MPDLSKTKSPTSLLVLLAIVFSLLSEQALATYCDASGSNYSEYQYIMGVQVGSINNIPTGNDHYADYTSLSTEMLPEVSYPITVTRGNPWDDVYDKCGLWVDWNRDEDFYDVGEEIVMSLGVDPCTFTGTITPPAGAVLGDTRMRIRITWNEVPQPCGHANYGEVEDYTIKVIEDNTGRISGIKFHDLNGNGIQEAGELGLAGWEIYLDLNDNGQWDAGEPKDVTDSSGFYEFPNLDPGDYTVAEVLKPGWVQTLPGWTGSRLFAVEENPSLYLIHELDPCDGAVINTFPVPEEITGIGLQGLAVGPTSLFFAGIRIVDNQPISVIWELDVDSGILIDTDAVELGAGFYPMSLAYLDDRVYIGKFTTGGPPNETEIAVFDPVQDTIVNTIIVPGTLGDGITGAADRGVLYATWSYDKIAEIEPATGSILRTINHTAGFKQGMAYLDGVIMMSSWARDLVHLIDPDTGQTVGSFILPENSYSSALGGDGIPATAYRAEIISGETFNLDFGNIETNSCGIKGAKWNDLNGNGIRDNGETGLEGWKIYMDSNNNGQYDQNEQFTITDGNGEYEFANLARAYYQVSEDQKCRWTQTRPTLVSNELIDVNTPRDLIFDSERSLLYIGTGSGTIERYDLVSGTLLSPYSVGTSLRGMDITPDGSMLYVTESQFGNGQGTVHKVQLSNGTVTDIAYELASGEAGCRDIQIGSHGKGLVTSTYDGTGHVPLREINLATDVLSIRTDSPVGTHAEQGIRIYRTADHTHFLLVGTLTNGRIFSYDAPSDTFGEEIERGAGLSRAPFALSPDGSLISYKLRDPILRGTNSLWIYKSDFTGVMAFDYGKGGVVFGPTRDLLYVACSEFEHGIGDGIIALNTKTWRELYRARISEDISAYSVLGSGEMAVSRDGRYLALTTASGVRLFRNYYKIKTLAGRTIRNINFGNNRNTIGDMDRDGDVDFRDFSFFASQFLEPDASCADFAPLPYGDGVVDWRDCASLANNWLADEAIIVYDESFETGDFSKFPWSTSGDALWEVATGYVFDGTFAAKSPILDYSFQKSILEVTLNVKAGQIAFLTYISAEYAKFYFYIDDQMIDTINNKKDWGQRTHPVSEGTHTFKWTYESDRYGNAYLDAIRFPPLVGQ